MIDYTGSKLIIIISLLQVYMNTMENANPSTALKLRKNQSTPPPTTPKYDIPQLIEQLKAKQGIPQDQLLALLKRATTLLKNEPTVLKVNSQVVVVGDIHGQFYDLINIFQKFGYPPKTRYLFLGDYVDRGRFCIEVINLLLAMKINYENDFFLLRGNHEGRTMTTLFNFKTQCQYKYNSETYEIFIDLFTCFPLCAIIDNRYFAVHAGISPQSRTTADIQKINRFLEIPQSGMLCDLLWSDPSDENRQEWVNNKNRSCSYFYSRNHSTKFLKENALRMIIRGHQVQMPGFKYQYGANQEPLALTIFSAPRYCDTYRNKGAVVVFNNKNISIQTYKEVEHPFVLSNYLNAFQLSFPLIASGVTKIFAYMLKLKRSKKGGKQNAQNRQELIKTLKQVQSIEQMLKGHAQQIIDLLTMEGMEKEEDNDQQDIIESLKQFIEMKCRRGIEIESLIFGPKRLQFVKIKVQDGDCDELTPD